MRYRVAHRQAAARPGLTQVLGSGQKSFFCVISQSEFAPFSTQLFGRCHIRLWTTDTSSELPHLKHRQQSVASGAQSLAADWRRLASSDKRLPTWVAAELPCFAHCPTLPN
jgi:hypothetical protein